MNRMQSAQLDGIRKIYTDKNAEKNKTTEVAALSNVDIRFFSGEVHTLLGENGAGKSTLVHILSGLFPPTGGTIQIANRILEFNSPLDAVRAGIGIVHQKPLLAEHASVFENILLGRTTTTTFVIDRKKALKKISEIVSLWKINIDLYAPVMRLSTREKFYTALIAALYRNPLFLILDEPGSVFSHNERTFFFKQMRKIVKNNGMGIIFITHSLEHAVKYSDRISILKAGKLVSSFTKDELPSNLQTAIALIEKNIFPQGKKNIKTVKIEKSITEKNFFCVLNLSAKSRYGMPLHTISFCLQKGTITGIIAYPNSGLYTLEDALSGMLSYQNKDIRGKIFIDGVTQQAHKITPAFLHCHKVAVIPSDRYIRGSHPSLSVFETLVSPYSAGFVFYKKKLQQTITSLLTEARIEASLERNTAGLSGGQLQRSIVQRELSRNPEVMILVTPEQGLDTETQQELQNHLRQKAESGMTILVLIKEINYNRYHHFFDRKYVLKDGHLREVLSN